MERVSNVRTWKLLGWRKRLYNYKTVSFARSIINQVKTLCIVRNKNLWNVSLLCNAHFSRSQKAPVWEITGAEFSKSEMHTADGISIRFPRCTRMRDDKDWKTATNLPQLKVRLL